MQHVERSDPERFIFGPYFLVPLLLAVAVLLLELGLVATKPRRHSVWRWPCRSAQRCWRPWASIGRALPGVLDPVPHATRRHTTLSDVARVGEFYVYAWLRRVPLADHALTVVLAGLVVVGPLTRDLDDLVAPRSWPIMAIAVLQLGLGIRRRDSFAAWSGQGA